jgi:hypothetical protein
MSTCWNSIQTYCALALNKISIFHTTILLLLYIDGNKRQEGTNFTSDKATKALKGVRVGSATALSQA